MHTIKILRLLLLLPSVAYAAEDQDIRLRLEQDLLQQTSERQQALKAQQQLDQLPVMVINGENIVVRHNLHDLGRGLYLAVMQKQWQAARIYLTHYEKLENYDVALAQFAHGALARAQGEADSAEQYFNQALNLQPENLMIQLELARLLTEQHKNQAAQQLFIQVREKLLENHSPNSAPILNTVDIYLKGLTHRDAWQGTVSLGMRHASNINSSSEKSSTWIRYAQDADGQQIPVEQVTRQTDKAISANAFDYEATLNKRESLEGQHGVLLKGFIYGRSYDEHANYNEMTLNLNAGYSYQTSNNQILLAPVFEHRRYQNQSLSNAWGARTEWLHIVNQGTVLKLEAEAKEITNKQYANQSGDEYSAFATVWKTLPQQWTLFTGLDAVDHNSEEQYFTAYQQMGMRLGVSKKFDSGIHTTLFGSLRWREYDKYNAVLEGKRKDMEKNYTVVVSAPQWQLHGITPNIMYQYNHNNSNVDWLYSYTKSNFSFKLDYRF